MINSVCCGGNFKVLTKYQQQQQEQQLRGRLNLKVLGDVFRTGDSAGLVTLREWTRVSGLVDAEQLRCQVQLVEEGHRKHGKK